MLKEYELETKLMGGDVDMERKAGRCKDSLPEWRRMEVIIR